MADVGVGEGEGVVVLGSGQGEVPVESGIRDVAEGLRTG